jgi:NADH:ubiquinone reductase (H+-translocating)
MIADEKTRIVILGGGFAGLHAAIHLDDTLARDPSLEITLVNRDNFFLFTPMLHEVAASDLDLTNIVNPVRKLLKRINFFAGEVESINLEKRLVTVSHGFDHHHHELPYDHLVIGLGSITNFFNLPGLEQRALTMKSLGDAIHLRNRLIAHLEEADTECSAALRRPLLTVSHNEEDSASFKMTLSLSGALVEQPSPRTAPAQFKVPETVVHNGTICD